MKHGKRKIYNYIKKYFNLPNRYEMGYFHYENMEILDSKNIEIIVKENEIEIKTYDYIEEEDIRILKNIYKKEGKIEI